MSASLAETPLQSASVANATLVHRAAQDLQRAENLMRENRLVDAREAAAAALGIWPAAARLLLGRIAIRQTDFYEAERVLRQAVASDDSEQARLLLVAALTGAGKTQEGTAVLDALMPTLDDTPERLFQAGGLYEGLGQTELAARCFLRSLEKDDRSARIWHRLGNVLLRQNNTAGAIEAFNVAFGLEPDNIDYGIDLGTAFARAGRFEEALERALFALRSAPDNLLALNNAGYALQCLNRSAEACAFYDRGAELSPDYAPVRFGRAIARLKSGDFASGWPEFNWRWQHGQHMRTDLGAPLWQGEDLRDKTILLHAEQGFGDTLQFVRVVSDVAAQGARVLMQVPPALVRLLELMAGLDAVFSVWDGSIPIDYHCPLLDVPQWISLRPDALLADPYLSAPLEMQAAQGALLRQRLSTGEGHPDLVVGLVWSGDPRPHDKGAALTDSRRSMSLSDLAPLFDVEGVRFVSFQLGAARTQIEGSGLAITDAMDGVTDFLDTAARLAGIDLLISVDTSMVHLAGGLGLPVWMLSRTDACWRWGDRGNQSAWYPQMRIMRQTRAYDWREPVAEAVACLRHVAHVYRGEMLKTHAGEKLVS